MASPKPYGLHVLSGELTDNDANYISSVIHRFLTYREAAQLENLKRVYTLPDGGYFIVQHMGNVFKIIADKQQIDKKTFTNDGLVKLFVPMFFSGVIERSQLKVASNEKVKLKLTKQCLSRISIELGKSVSEILELERFSIDQSSDFPEFLIKDDNGLIKRTQYFAQNPGWYTGTMAKLHQFVGGYGVLAADRLPDNEVERIKFTLPESLWLYFQEKYDGVRLPAYQGIPDLNGVFKYHYSFKKTHAVVFDNERNPWLIQVTNKVYAMPLPIIPVTRDPKFREYVENDLGDAELIEILNTFGAMPSGESFPDDRHEFEQWVRAGVIIKICDNEEMAGKNAFFTACGWSFNTSGSMAVNTAWNYDERGLIEASTYKLNLNLIASEHHYGLGKVSLASTQTTDDESRQVAQYISTILAEIDSGNNTGRTIQYKLRRADVSEILSRAKKATDINSEINYWDNYVCQPIANHTGKVSKIYTGKLYHHAKPEFQPQIKFPDFQMGMCVSFDFSPIEKNVSSDCDTIMYAYFDEDNLKVVKYFYTSKTFQKAISTDFEGCMTVGSWRTDESIGLSSIAGHFYLTDIDDRIEISAQVKEMTVKGDDKGYDTKPFFSFTSFWAMNGTMWRNRYFSRLTKTKTTTGQTMVIGLMVPMFNRSNVLYGHKSSAENISSREVQELLYVRDPYQYRFWTYHPIFAYHSPLSKQTGKPVPVNGNPVWVEIEEYAPSDCSDFADQGGWVGGMPADYTWLIHPDSNTWMHSGGGGPPKVQEYVINKNEPTVEVGSLRWAVSDRIHTISGKPAPTYYFLPSPNQSGSGVSATSSKVFLGSAEYVNISEQGESGRWQYIGRCNLVNNTRAYHFIGVINE